MTQQANQIDLSIVIPAYREARALETFLPRLLAEASALTPSFEVLIVDTMEPIDDTQAVAQSAGARHLFRTGGNFYGNAVNTGIDNARGKYLLFMDGDGSHNPIEMKKLWSLHEQFDIVIGSRYIAGGQTENPAILIWMSQAINYIYRLVFRLNVHDVSNSFRIYRADPLRLLTLESNDFDIVEEILLRLVFGPSKATVTEVPVTFEQRKAGESKRKLLKFALSYISSIRKMHRFRKSEQQRSKTKG
jgi:dolichol-phosphate mannosyltransferase